MARHNPAQAAHYSCRTEGGMSLPGKGMLSTYKKTVIITPKTLLYLANIFMQISSFLVNDIRLPYCKYLIIIQHEISLTQNLLQMKEPCRLRKQRIIQPEKGEKQAPRQQAGKVDPRQQKWIPLSIGQDILPGNRKKRANNPDLRYANCAEHTHWPRYSSFFFKRLFKA